METTLVNTTTYREILEQVIPISLDSTGLTIGNFETQAILFEKVLSDVEYYIDTTRIFNQSTQKFASKRETQRNPFFDVDLVNFVDDKYFDVVEGGTYDFYLENIFLAVDPADIGAEVMLTLVKVASGILFPTNSSSVVTIDVPDDIAVPTRYFGYLSSVAFAGISCSTGDKMYIIATLNPVAPIPFDLIIMDNAITFTVEKQ